MHYYNFYTLSSSYKNHTLMKETLTYFVVVSNEQVGMYHFMLQKSTQIMNN